jgi:hypothetical protein
LRTLRVFIPVLACLAHVLLFAPQARAELRLVSRNSLVFVDAQKKGAEEWTAYRIADERHPVVLRVEGPGRVILRLRSIPGEPPKEAVAAVLNDQRIVLTARVEPVADTEVKLVEGGGKQVTKARIYLVRIPRGEHTVTVRYSEGGPLLVSPTFAAGEAGTEEEALVSPSDGDDVPNVGALRIGEDEVEGGESEIERPSADDQTAQRARDESWRVKKRDAPAQIESPTGPSEEALDPADPFYRKPPAPSAERTLTVQAPFLMIEARGGVLVSRLGLDPAPVFGLGFRTPIPGLDAHAFSIGVSIDASFARGDETVIGETSRDAIGVAKLRHNAVELAADARWAFLSPESTFAPYVGAGVGALFGKLSTDDGSSELDAATTGVLGVGRAGAAVGALGGRPFVELRFAAGKMFSDLAKSSPADSGSAAYSSVQAVLGYRLELTTETPTE